MKQSGAPERWAVSAQALAEKEGEGMAKMIYRTDTGEILGVHIFGLHAADLIHEASNAVATRQTISVRSLLGAPVCVFAAVRAQSPNLPSVHSFERDLQASRHCCCVLPFLKCWGALKSVCAPAGHQV